jgi:hypothetical protein
MSHQCLADAFAPWEASYKSELQKYTWGHLAAIKNKTYRGFILFADSAYDGPVLLDSDFKGLDDSPWLYDAMIDFMRDCLTGRIVENKYGRVYRFDGTLRNYEFKGTVRLIVGAEKGGA